MQDFEKLGAFYLGRTFDLESRQTRPDLLLYESKDLTTHAVCVGMTGSGKTGLCLSLLEEAAIDGIPAIAIDPKGDLGNLLLTFPKLRPEDFRPWVDPDEAARGGMTADQLAAKAADTWAKGLADWGQDGSRIGRFRSAVDLSIYTPGSDAGLGLSLLRSFSAPPPAVIGDADALRQRINSAVGGLLTLLGIDADPIQSREHILLANLLDRAWREGRDLDMGALLRQIQSPPFEKVGFLELESFFPAKDRFELAVRMNNLVASPGFAAWTEGEPLDAGRLFYTPDGRPRLSIVSIAHLSDAERMFFVTVLLGEVLAWMRSQPGTSSLRALVYMDEVFGYFPPTANPPSKEPMLTLLKQARAYGLGMVLATQNPVDLDYKGLSNAGTWLLGRLQTERDKLRVLDGLEGASAAAGTRFDRQKLDRTLAGLGNRVFLINNVHDDEPVVFQTRWALSYLRGPLTREQIRTLMARRKTAEAQAPAAEPAEPAEARPAPAPPPPPAEAATSARPVLPPGVPEQFWPSAGPVAADETLAYRPALLGTARLHFVRASAGLDHWQTVSIVVPATGGLPEEVWASGELVEGRGPDLDDAPIEPAAFAPVPAEMTEKRNYASWTTGLKNYVYRARTLTLFKSPELKETSGPGETEGEFRIRLAQLAREERDLEVAKLRKRYAPKLASLQGRIRRAEEKLDREKSQYRQRSLETVVSVGQTILGGLFGRKLASVTSTRRAASTARAMGRAGREKDDVARAEDALRDCHDDLTAMEAELQEETRRVRESFDPAALAIEPLEVRPRKSDISVGRVVMVWTPWRVDGEGVAVPAF